MHVVKHLRIMAAMVLAVFAGTGADCRAADPPALTLAVWFHDTGWRGRDNLPFFEWGHNGEGGDNPHFHAVLTNVSGHPLCIWRETCVAGRDALTFQVKDAAGRTWTARRLDKVPQEKAEQGKAPPPYWLLQPGESIVFDIYFGDRPAWGDGFWLPPGNPTGVVTLQAFYKSPPAPKSGTQGVEIWSGEVDSQPVECVIK